MKEYARITLALSLFSCSLVGWMVQRLLFCEGLQKPQNKKEKFAKRRIKKNCENVLANGLHIELRFLDINYVKVACMCNLFASFHNTAKNLNCKKELCGVEMVFERFSPFTRHTQHVCTTAFDTLNTYIIYVHYKPFHAVFIITICLIIKKRPGWKQYIQTDIKKRQQQRQRQQQHQR